MASDTTRSISPTSAISINRRGFPEKLSECLLNLTQHPTQSFLARIANIYRTSKGRRMFNPPSTKPRRPIRRPSPTTLFGLFADSRRPEGLSMFHFLDSPHHHSDVGLVDEKSGLVCLGWWRCCWRPSGCTVC